MARSSCSSSIRLTITKRREIKIVEKTHAKLPFPSLPYGGDRHPHAQRGGPCRNRDNPNPPSALEPAAGGGRAHSQPLAPRGRGLRAKTGLGPRFTLPPVHSCPAGVALAIASGNGIHMAAESPFPSFGHSSECQRAAGAGPSLRPPPSTDIGRHTVIVVVGGGSPF